MADRDALHVLARALSAPPGLGRQGVIAEHEALCEPRGDGAAAGRVLPAAESERAGGLLPPNEGPVGDAAGDHGHGTYTRPPARHAAETWHGLRTPEYGRLRTTVPQPDGPELDSPGKGILLGRTPVVKRHTTPRSGFFSFFPLYSSRRGWPLATCPDLIAV